MAGKENEDVWKDFDSTINCLIDKPVNAAAGPPVDGEASREEGEASDTDPEDECSNCSFSHKSEDCRAPCQKCDSAQHTNVDCPIVERTISNPASNQGDEGTSEDEDECRICQNEDHKTEDCPDFKCKKCGVQGHSKNQCTAPESKIKVASWAKLTKLGIENSEQNPTAEKSVDLTNIVNREKEVVVASSANGEKAVAATPAKSLPDGISNDIVVMVTSDKRTAVSSEPLEKSKSRQSSGKSTSDGSSSTTRSKGDESLFNKSSKAEDLKRRKRSRSKDSGRRIGDGRSRSKNRTEPSDKRRRHESKGTSSRISREPRTRERTDQGHRNRSRSRKRLKNYRSRSRNRQNSGNRDRGKRRRTQSKSPNRKSRLPTARTADKKAAYQHSSSASSYSGRSEQEKQLINAPDFAQAASKVLSGTSREAQLTLATSFEAKPSSHPVRPNLKVIATDAIIAETQQHKDEIILRKEIEPTSHVNRILEIDNENKIDESMLNNFTKVKTKSGDKILYKFDHEFDAIMAKKKIISSNSNFSTTKNDIVLKPTDLKEEILIMQKESEQCIDKTTHAKFMYLAVSVDKISACSVTSGLGESPIHISMYSRGGSLSCYVPPNSFLQDGKKKPLLAKSGCKMTSKECLEYTDINGEKVDINIFNEQKSFVDKLNKIMRSNLKKYDDTNVFDDCLLVFEDWKDMSIFFNWVSFSTDQDYLNSCSRVSVVDNFPKADVCKQSSDERCRLLHYKVEELVRNKNFHVLYDKSVEIPCLLPCGNVYMDSTPHNICVLSVKYIKHENTNVLTQIGCIILRPDAERVSIQDINSFGKELSPQLLDKLNIKPTDRVNTEASALQEILSFCQREGASKPTTLVTCTSHNTLTVFLKAIQRHEKEKLFYSLFSNYTDLFTLSKYYFSKTYDLNAVPVYKDLCQHLGITPQEGSTNSALEMSKSILICVEKILTKFHMFFEIKDHSKPVSKLFFAEHKTCFAKVSKDISIEAHVDIVHTVQFSLRKGKASSPKDLSWSHCYSPHWKVLHADLLEKEATIQIKNLTGANIFLKKDEKLLKIYEAIDPLMVPAELVHEYRNVGTSIDDINQHNSNSLETVAVISSILVPIANEENEKALRVVTGRIGDVNLSSSSTIINIQKEDTSQPQTSLAKECHKELETFLNGHIEEQDAHIVIPKLSSNDPNENLFISNRNEKKAEVEVNSKKGNNLMSIPGIHYDYQFMKKHPTFKKFVDAYHLYKINEDHTYKIKEGSSKDGDKINEYVYGCDMMQQFYDAFSSFEHLIECMNDNLSTITLETVSDHFKEKTYDVFSDVFSDEEFVKILLYYNKSRDVNQSTDETNSQSRSGPEPETDTTTSMLIADIVEEEENASTATSLVIADIVEEVENASEKETTEPETETSPVISDIVEGVENASERTKVNKVDDKVENNCDLTNSTQNGLNDHSVSNASSEGFRSDMETSDSSFQAVSNNVFSAETTSMDESTTKIHRFKDHEKKDFKDSIEHLSANAEICSATQNDAEGYQVLLDSNSYVSYPQAEDCLKLETQMDIDEKPLKPVNCTKESFSCSICHFDDHKKEDCTYCKLCQRFGHKSQDCNYCIKCKTDGHRVQFCSKSCLVSNKGHTTDECTEYLDQDISENFNPDENFGDLYLCEVREVKDTSMTAEIDGIGKVFISQKSCDFDICLEELLLVSLTNATSLPYAGSYIRLKDWEKNPSFFSGEIKEIKSKTKAVVAFKNEENMNTAILPLDRIIRVDGKVNYTEDLKQSQVKVIVQKSDGNQEISSYRVSLCLIIPNAPKDTKQQRSPDVNGDRPEGSTPDNQSGKQSVKALDKTSKYPLFVADCLSMNSTSSTAKNSDAENALKDPKSCDVRASKEPTSPEVTMIGSSKGNQIIDNRAIRVGTVVEMKEELGIIKTDFGKYVLFHTKDVYGPTLNDLNDAIQTKTKFSFKAVKAKSMIKTTAKLFFNNSLNIDLCAMLIYRATEPAPKVPTDITEYVLQSRQIEYMRKKLREKTPQTKTSEENSSFKKETFLSKIKEQELHPQCPHFKDIGLLCKDYYVAACTKTHDFCHGLPEYADNLVEYCENFLIEGNCTKAKCLKKNLNIGVLQNKIRTELFKKRNKCRLCKENEGEKIGCSLLSKREKEAFGLCCFVFQRNKNCMSGKRCRYLHRIPKHLGFTEYVNNVVYRNEVAKIQKHCRLCEGSSLVEEPVIQVEVPARPGSASSSENSGRRVKLVDAPRRSSRDLLTLDAEKEDLRGVLSSQPTLVSYDVLAIEDYSINMDLCTVNGRVRAKPEDLANLLNKKVRQNNCRCGVLGS